MVERFVESLATANDSGLFDTSLEVKPLIVRKRSKCITELDREELARFVQEFKERNQNANANSPSESPNVSLSKSFLMPKSTPFSTPAIKRRQSLNIGSQIMLKQKLYENSIIAASTPLYLTENGSSRLEIQGSPLPIRNLVKILENSLPKLVINPPTPIDPEPKAFPTENQYNSSASGSSGGTGSVGDTMSTDSDLGYSEHDYCADDDDDDDDTGNMASDDCDNNNDDDDDEYYEEDESEYLEKPSSDQDSDELPKTPKNRKSSNEEENNNFKKPSSASKCEGLKNFITTAHKKVKKLKNGNSSSCNSSRTSSPVLLRAKHFLHLGIRPLSNFGKTHNSNNDGDGTSCDSDHDDGISSTSSQNISPDSSFEMQPPIVPDFKITPSAAFRRSNPAYELARILRGSFRSSLRSKRATVATLRRSLSDPDQYQLSEILAQGAQGTFEQKNNLSVIGDNNIEFVQASEPIVEEKSCLREAIIRNLDSIRSRALPSSTNTSPFRRWGQSSFRTVRTTPPDQRPTINRRPSSLAASENDVYTKSMDDFINDDINSVHSQSDGGEFTQIGRAKALAVNFLNAVSAQQNHAATVLSNSSNNNNNNNNNFKSLTKRVEIWGNSFEKLLADPAGLHTFAEFLKKEFSAENIYFWTACERYRHINDDTERAQKAVEIFSKHLGSGALEPVNVDSQARSLAEENLQTADRNLFNYAQKQIYNLMKFDSYQRFIRSDLYKKCQEAEAKNQTLPYTGENLSDSLKTSIMLNSPGPAKLKKSASNAEDRRRKSLLPWHRKARCKSRDRNNENIPADNNSEINPLSKSQSSSGNTLKLQHTNSTSDIHSSRSSLSSFDTNTCLTSSSTTAFNNASDEAKKNFCRVIFSDGATTVTLTRPDQTVRQLIERLLEKRGFKYQFFDVLLSSNSKSLDLESSSNILMGKEVQVEQRVAFKLDLPDPKVISVKSKPKKALCDVLKPILQKYNYRFEEVQILMRDTHEQIELSLPVTAVDGQRLEVVLLRNDNLWKQQQLHKRNGLLLTAPSSAETSNFQHQHPLGAVHKNYILTNKNHLLNGSKNLLSASGQLNQQSTLDEITNKVFTEVLQGKVDSHENIMTKSVDLCSLRSDDCASESSSTYDRSKFRDVNALNVKNPVKPKKTLTINTAAPTTVNKFLGDKITSNTAITQSDENLNINNCNNSNNNVQSSNSNLAGVKKPLIAKWKTGVKLQVTARAHNQEEFLEGLKRAQRARLEDQRGTEINFELPDFLKDKANLSAANKLRKIRANLNPITTGVNNITTNQNASKSSSGDCVGLPNSNRNSLDSSTDRPQPAPRLSIAKSASSIAITSNRTLYNNNKNIGHLNLSPTLKSDFQHQLLQQDSIINSNNNNNLSTDNLNLINNTVVDFIDDIANDDNISGINSVKGPPPLPPKPKILPIKPSNWGQLSTSQSSIQLSQGATNQAIIDLIPIRRTLNNDMSAAKNAYLDQPSSSFV